MLFFCLAIVIIPYIFLVGELLRDRGFWGKEDKTALITTSIIVIIWVIVCLATYL